MRLSWNMPLALIVAVGGVFALSNEARADFLRLNDGTILQGKILDHDDLGITVQRLDNGGTVKLRWAQLQNEDRTRLRKGFGLELPDFRGMVTCLGDRIELIEGEPVEGRIVEEDNNRYSVEFMDEEKEKLAQKSVPKNKVRDVYRNCQINALALRTRKELYDQVLGEHPPKDANGEYLMAQYCKLLGVYDKGLDHIARAVAGKPELESRLAPLRDLFTDLLAQAGLRKQLEDVGRLIRRMKFGEAEAAITAILAEPKISDSIKALADEKKALLDQTAGDAVSKKFYDLIETFAQRKISEPNCDLGTAKGYATGQMHQDILNALAAQFGLPADRCQNLFNARDKTKYRTLKVSFDLAALEGRMDLRSGQGQGLAPGPGRQGQQGQGQGQGQAQGAQAQAGQIRDLMRQLAQNPEARKKLEDLMKGLQQGGNMIKPGLPETQDENLAQQMGGSMGQPEGRSGRGQGNGQGAQGQPGQARPGGQPGAQNQGQGANGQQANQQQVSPEEMWKKAPTTMRKSYVIYLYCERNKGMERVRQIENIGVAQIWYR